MSTTTKTETTQVYRVHIRTTPEAVWKAITDPEWTVRYGYGAHGDFDLRPGGAFKFRMDEDMKRASIEKGLPTPELVVDGEVIEVDEPRRLVLNWRLLLDPESAAEGFTRLTYDIKEMQPGVVRLTVTHELENAHKLASLVSGSLEEQGAGGGWSWILSDLKSVLETGRRLAG